MIGLHFCDSFKTKGGRLLEENGGEVDKTTFWCLKCTQENCPCVEGIKHKTANSLNTSVSPQCWFSETHQMVTFSFLNKSITGHSPATEMLPFFSLWLFIFLDKQSAVKHEEICFPFAGKWVQPNHVEKMTAWWHFHLLAHQGGKSDRTTELQCVSGEHLKAEQCIRCVYVCALLSGETQPRTSLLQHRSADLAIAPLFA